VHHLARRQHSYEAAATAHLVTVAGEIMTMETRSSLPASVPLASAWRPVIALPLIVLAIAAGLALIWYSAPSLLLLFAGILFASLLDACTRSLGRILPLPRRTRYALVVLILGSALFVAIAWSMLRAPGQIRALISIMD